MKELAPIEVGDVEIVIADLDIDLVGDESFAGGEIGLIDAKGVFVIGSHIGEEEEDLISLGRPDQLRFKGSTGSGQFAEIIEDAGGQIHQVRFDP